MTLNQALHLAEHKLVAANIEDASFEAEWLLCHVLQISKAGLYSNPERALRSAEVRKLQHLVWRRLHHEPMAYILECCQFYGIDFYVDGRVLIPRPETELLVEEAIQFARHDFPLGRQPAIADIGTGSGAIAVSLALALPQAVIYATDISPSALQVARTNCERHKVDGRITLLCGNLLQPLPKPVDMIVANLPYVRSCDLTTLSQEITEFEPTKALAGGEDGLGMIRCLLNQLQGRLYPGGCLLLEVGQGQAEAVRSLANSYLPQANTKSIADLGGIDRAIKVML
jgi:release factor glutamine methyltransferase